MAVSGSQRVWPMALALAVATTAVCVSMQTSMRITIAVVVLAAYLPSYVDGAEYTGERVWPRFAVFMRKISTFPQTLEHEEPLDASKQYIFCSHPHGLLSIHHGNLLAGSSTPSFHDTSPMHMRRHLAASVCFRIPFYREYLLWLGCVDARRSIAEKMLRKGKSVVILVGGIAEQMLSQVGDHTIYVKKRKGHIRLALKYGTPIVPGYAFGETDLYTHSSTLLSFRRAVAKQFSVALLMGYGSNPWFPLRPHDGVVINHVFGKPIEVEKKEHPTPEDVDKIHEKYVSELVRVFEKYKEQYGYKDFELKVC